jgi:alpha-beta hydrolase superfamily lysophospholipase
MSFAHLRPFRTLAEHLAANGIASLRYDKRGIGESGGDFQSATRNDLADDASAALHFLGRHEAILPDRMGLLGQSEGGIIAPMVAADSDDVAFVVLLAGPAISGRDNLVLSFAMFAEASPSHDSSSTEVKGLLNRLLDLVHAESPSRDERAAALQLAEKLAPRIINERTKLVLGGADITAEQFLDLLSSPCLEENFQSTPGTYLCRLTCPTLALYAERDRHVSPGENMAAMKKALAAAGNRESTVETIAGVNHMFQRCETGYPDEYLTIDHDISPDVLARVSGWIIGLP